MDAFTVFAVFALLTISNGALDFNYHDHAAMEQYLKDVTSMYPDITHLYSIGKSLQGAELWVIAIGQSPQDHVTLRPNVKYIGNMHGNEVSGREILLHLVDHYVTEYGNNNSLTTFLNTTTVHIMPTMNPDGFAVSIEGNCSGVVGRYNSNHLDLNRNFPDKFVDNPAVLQQETRLIMKWITEKQFVLSINFHGGVEVVNYPWDSFTDANNIPLYSKSPDDDVFIYISKVFSFSHSTMHLGRPCYNDSSYQAFKDGITNGAEWYPVTGGMQDYNYVVAGCMEVLVEVTCCKYPPRSELPQIWEDNRDALINYLMLVHMGVKGLVKDTNNNAITGAKISVEGRDEIVFKTTSAGEYWRLLMPGDYSINFSADDYVMTTKKVKVVDGQVTLINVELQEVTTTSGSGCCNVYKSFVWASVFCVYAYFIRWNY